MNLDSDWYAYQCKSGEVLFYYNASTGEHRWTIHFCSCLKSKMASGDSTEPCCLWEPVKSQTSESGKFVRSIGTETEDKYFSGTSRSCEQNDDRNSSPRTEITFEYSVSKDKPSEENRTGSNYTTNDKPIEVLLEDPFLPESNMQNVSSKCMTLKLKEISREEFSLPDNNPPKKVSDKVDNLTFPGKSLTTSNKKPEIYIDQHKNDEIPNKISSDKHTFMRQRKAFVKGSTTKRVPHSLSSSCTLEERPFCLDNLAQNKASLSLDNLPKRQKGSASSRKNPEPKKLLKRCHSSISEQCAEERVKSDKEEQIEKEPRETLFDDIEENDSNQDTLVLLGQPSSSLSSAATHCHEDDDANDDTDNQNICELCGKECVTAAMLTNHLMMHQPTGTTCPVCNKYFSRRQGLRYHVQTHSGDKPHVCKICNKTFTKSASLVAHVRTHSGIRPFKCPKCNKGFTHSSNLSSHLRIHSSLRPYRCKFCSKGFKTSSHLSLHLRSHSDERPYKCSDCGKAFKNSSHLRSHEKLHLMPKTVFCNGCGEGFRSFSHLMYHQQTSPQCIEEDKQIELGRSHMGEQRTQKDSKNDIKSDQSHMRDQTGHSRNELEYDQFHIEEQI